MLRTIRRFEPRDHERVLRICVAAFTPIHEGFARALGPEIFEREYAGWRERYGADLERLARDPSTQLHVVEEDGEIAGFVTTTVDAKKKMGEVGLNAVDPARQGCGLGKQLVAFALENLASRGAEIAFVGTGADAAHAPARAVYQKSGFERSIPSVHYFREL
jgi:ribosomal protein S18 acetylase RimI-like enzyme